MKVIADSDFLIAFRFDNQSTYKKAKQIHQHLQTEKPSHIYILNLCIYETATVISKKYSQDLAIKFVIDIKKLASKNKITTVDIDKKIETIAWQIFSKQTKKNISFVDCAVLATYQIYKFDKILSFDTFYPTASLLAP